jgi:hypothetical protein
MTMHICIQLLTLEHCWELFDHPPYSADVTPRDCHLFTYLKNSLGSQCFNNNEELMEGVKTWLSSQAADLFDTGIQNLFPNMTYASVPEVTTLGSGINFMYITFFSLLVLLTDHQILLSE